MWWSNLFTDASPASFFNFSFLPKYAAFFVQDTIPSVSIAARMSHKLFFIMLNVKF